MPSHRRSDNNAVATTVRELTDSNRRHLIPKQLIETINEIEQTGDRSFPWPWVLWGFAAAQNPP
jgi:hypothetical protein